MHKSITMRVGAVGAAFAMAGGLAVIASGTTGAYFSEAKTGSITGTIGSVHLSTSNTTFVWSDMMPGEMKSATVDFTNMGSGAQDFYLVFPNLTALSALNDLGTYGEAHLSVNGVEKFASANLTDHYPSGTPGINGAPTLIRLPQSVLLASDVPAGAGNTFKFEFKYDGKLGAGSSGGVGVFNSYPVAGQVTTVPADGTGAGLPFKVVAVQVGQTP